MRSPNGRGHWRYRMRACLGIFTVLPLFVSFGDEGPAEALIVLYPGNRTVVDTRKVEIIAYWPGASSARERPLLRVDGQECPWEPFALPILVARIHLLHGTHKLQIGETELTIFINVPSARTPEGWPVSRKHRVRGEDWTVCSDCHEVEDAQEPVRVGPARGNTACTACHGQDNIAERHAGTPEAGQDWNCVGCHRIHGAQCEKLLKTPCAAPRPTPPPAS